MTWRNRSVISFLAIMAYLASGAALGWFCWEVTASESVSAALFGPGVFERLPKPRVEACAVVGWAMVGGLALLWRRLGAGAWPCLPLLLLAGVALPDGALLAPYLVILAVAGAAGLTLLLAASARQAEQDAPRPTKRHVWAVAAMALAYFVVFSTMSLLQYAALNVSDTDTTSFDRMLWFTLRGRILYTGQACFFGDHMQPILLLLLPFYWLWPGLNVLMLIQTLALASGALAVYMLARRRLAPGLAVALAGAYLLYPAMQFVNLEGTFNTFRPISFSVPLLLWAFTCLDRGRLWPCTVCLVGALFCKEEFGLIVFTFGVYAALKHRRWRWGAVMAGVGLVWFVVCVQWVIPHFRGGPLRFIPHYSHLGATPAEVAKTVVLHPLKTLAQSPLGEYGRFLLALLTPLALLPLLGWECLLVAAPALAYSLLSNRPAQRSILFHYHAPIVPFCVAAAVFGCARLLKWLRRWRSVVQSRRAVAASLVCASVCASILLSKSPLSIAFWNPHNSQSYRLYRLTSRSKVLAELRGRIPASGSLEASNFISAHFTHRARLFRYPCPDAKAEYVLVDLNERWLDRVAALADLRDRVAVGRYVLEFQKEGIMLLRCVEGLGER